MLAIFSFNIYFLICLIYVLVKVPCFYIVKLNWWDHVVVERGNNVPIWPKFHYRQFFKWTHDTNADILRKEEKKKVFHRIGNLEGLCCVKRKSSWSFICSVCMLGFSVECIVFNHILFSISLIMSVASSVKCIKRSHNTVSIVDNVDIF